MTRKSTKRPEDRAESHDHRIHKGRRRLLQALTVGGALTTAKTLPDHWTRPMVDAVVLPAHAQTSGGIMTGETIVTVNETMIQQTLERSLSDAGFGRPDPSQIRISSAPARERSLLDYVISPAAATTEAVAFVQASCEDNGDVTVSFLFAAIVPCVEGPDLEFEFNLCVTGNFGNKALNETTVLNSDCGTPTDAEIVAIDDDSAVLRLSGGPFSDFEIELNRGGTRPPCPDCQDEIEDITGSVKKCEPDILKEEP